MRIAKDCPPCKTYKSIDCIVYMGEDLPNLNIQSGNTLTNLLSNIEEVMETHHHWPTTTTTTTRRHTTTTSSSTTTTTTTHHITTTTTSSTTHVPTSTTTTTTTTDLSHNLTIIDYTINHVPYNGPETGRYLAGVLIPIVAIIPDGCTFDQWFGGYGIVTDMFNPNTVATMPSEDWTLNAVLIYPDTTTTTSTTTHAPTTTTSTTIVPTTTTTSSTTTTSTTTINSFVPKYFVANSGNDSNNGLSIGTAWKTISKVNSMVFAPGDTIGFKCSDTWRENLIIPSSGIAGNYISVGSYSTGAKPQILGSTLVTSWTNTGGNIWIGASIVTDPYALSYKGNIYFIELNNSVTWGRVKKANTAACVAEYDWTWSSNRIYIYSPTDPNLRYSGVEVSQRVYGINLNQKQYLTFNNLEIAYTGSYGIGESAETNLTGLTITNCLIHHIGIKASLAGYGIEQHHSNSFIQNNIIHDSGRRNISLDLYGNSAQVHDILIENNTIYNGFHTAGVDMNSQGASTLNNVIIRRNYFYNELTANIDNVEYYGSSFIYCANDGGGSVNNIYIYYNIFKNATAAAMAFGGAGGTDGAFVWNNTFYGVSPYITATYNSIILIQAGSNVQLRNNIFYNDVQIALNPTFSLINIVSDAGVVTTDYNVYYNTQATRNIAWYGTSYSVSQWSAYKSASGQDGHSYVSQNPLFISSSDYHLQVGSVAINHGINLGLTIDYDGNPIVGIPDIGCMEFQ